MSKARLTIVYPLDPIGPKVGGSVSFIRGLVRHAPEDFDLRFIGVTADPAGRPPRRWTTLRLGERQFQFLPLFAEIDEDRRRPVPLSLRFVAHLARTGLPDDDSVLLHNRIETALTPGARLHRSAIVIHNDLDAQIGSSGSEMLWARMPRLYYAMERRALRNVDHVYTVSSRTLEGLQRRYASSGDRFSFLPTWVDPQAFGLATASKTELRASLQRFGVDLDPTVPWILFAGRLQRQKAPERLLEAFAKLRSTRPRVALLIVGSGNLRPDVERRVAELSLGEVVRMVPAVSQGDLRDFYQACDLLALTSNFEGMPMGVLEALACGLPVATTRVGEVARVVICGETGEISRSSETDDVVAAIAQILSNPDRYTARRCATAVGDYYPARILQPVYDKLLTLHRMGRPGRRDRRGLA